MKRLFSLIFLLLTLNGVAQENIRDSLLQELRTVQYDSSRIWLLYELAGIYRFNRPDSAIYYGKKAWELARRINHPAGEVAALRYMAISHITLGNDGKALQLDLEGIKLADQHGLLKDKMILLNHVGGIYLRSRVYAQALTYYKASLLLADSSLNHTWNVYNLSDLGETFMLEGQIDSAQYYSELSYDYALRNNVDKSEIDGTLANLGKTYQKQGKNEMAVSYFLQSLRISNGKDRIDKFRSTFPLAEFYYEINELDSSKFYARESLNHALEGNLYRSIIQSSNLLSSIYKKSDTEQAFEFKEMAMAYQDSLYNLGRQAALEDYINFDEQERQRELDDSKAEFQSQLRTNAFLGSSFTLIVIAIVLYRSNRAKQRSKRKIEVAYERLQNTQTQLIHSEKMASLGELTAGIAHEIQNPLNFVNNFSDVNKELIEELLNEMKKGNVAEAEIIGKDILDNEDKIVHHGKRAEGIVKSMLQHSRTSSGGKELTDINALADEYLRLAYHGFRAKDKSFNADFKTELDESLPKISVVPQDIGRVLLNLINNAFQAVKDVDKPEVLVRIRRMDSPLGAGGSAVEIRVKDNGPGIPDDIKEKIFQPFFTTKPTGEGTGLGLSLSYDIVTKGHGGELKVESPPASGASKGGIGTEFLVSLPIQKNQQL